MPECAPMAPIIIWFFLAIVQVTGVTGNGASTQAECEEKRVEMAAQEDTIMISPECVQIKLESLDPEAPKVDLLQEQMTR